MKKFFRIASIFLILASFIGCKPDVEVNEKTGSIQGKAFYENENVSDYSGIQVSLISTNGLMAVDYCESRGIATNARKVEDIMFTDSEGKYNFTDVPEGVYTICASSDNSTKKAVLTNVTVTAGRTITASDLGLTATGSITGKITIDGSTDGVLGLDVFIAGTSFIAKVGSDGNYEITNIPAKKGYVLCVQKGEKTKIIAESVEVKGDESSSVGIYDISSDGWISEYIKWLGAFEIAPENPKLYWAYFSTKDGCSYIWNGTNWDLLSQSGSDNSKFITCTAVEEGIKFTGNLLSNIVGQTAKCNIKVVDTHNGITMNRSYKIDSDTYESWEMIYPLVEKGQKYNFEVILEDQASILSSQKFNVTAIGGLGEFKVENADSYKVILSDDKKTLSRTSQEYTDNSKVLSKIIDYGTKYAVYSNNSEVTSIWDGIWRHESVYWKSTSNQECDLTSMEHWYTYEDLDLVLKGRRLGVYTETHIKIAGYTYTGTTVFSLNDYKETFFDWDDEEENKYLLLYVDPVTGDYYKDVPGTSLFYIKEELDENGNVIFSKQGAEGVIEVYGQLISYGDKIYEPTYVPKIENEDFVFSGLWNAECAYQTIEEINFPYSSTEFGAKGETIPVYLTPKNLRLGTVTFPDEFTGFASKKLNSNWYIAFFNINQSKVSVQNYNESFIEFIIHEEINEESDEMVQVVYGDHEYMESDYEFTYNITGPYDGSMNVCFWVTEYQGNLYSPYSKDGTETTATFTCKIKEQGGLLFFPTEPGVYKITMISKTMK